MVCVPVCVSACVCACVCLCLCVRLCVRARKLVSVCDKSGSVLWSATEASVIGQAMSLLLLKGFFARRRGHRRVILPFVGREIPLESPHSLSLTKLLTRFGRHVFQLSNLWLFSIITTYVRDEHLLPHQEILICDATNSECSFPKSTEARRHHWKHLPAVKVGLTWVSGVSSLPWCHSCALQINITCWLKSNVPHGQCWPAALWPLSFFNVPPCSFWQPRSAFLWHCNILQSLINFTSSHFMEIGQSLYFYFFK